MGIKIHFIQSVFPFPADFVMASVLVVGGGGRENAIAWKLSLSTKVRILIIEFILSLFLYLTF